MYEFMTPGNIGSSDITMKQCPSILIVPNEA